MTCADDGGRSGPARHVGEPRPRVHVLMTVHNRKGLTLRCLERVAAQSVEADVGVIVVDDGSTDGTAAEVRQRFPEVRLVEGSGQLYWNGGMRRAFELAMADDPAFCLLLNDDTHLLPGGLGRMLATHDAMAAAGARRCVVVGSARDPETGRQSYGGWRLGGRWIPARMRRVEPGPEPRRCDTMHGNCVLIPRDVYRLVGNLDEVFTHSMGDLDYGLRARRAGCSLWVAPGYVAECVDNSGMGLWVEAGLAASETWKRLLGPKGLPPSEWLVFTSRHYGPLWPVLFLWPYVKVSWQTLRRLLPWAFERR